MAQLDEYLRSEEARKQPAVVNALTMKLEVFQKLIAREDEQRDLGAQIVALEEQLAAFDGVDPQAVSSLTEENKSLRIQLENTRASNANTVIERDDARGNLANVTSLLGWLSQQVNEPKKLTLAVRAFAEHGKDSKSLVDLLLGTGTTEEWLRASLSKEKLIETYRQHRNATNAEGGRLREFSKSYLKLRHEVDIDKHLAAEAEATRKQEESEEQRHEQAIVERERAIARQRRDAAMEDMIHRAEHNQSSPAPRPRGDLEW